MLIQANMPQSFWTEAVTTVAQIKNMLPHSFFKDLTSPYKHWFQKAPPLEHLRPFRCTVYALIPKERCPPRSKYLTRATKGCLINYIGGNSYRYYDFSRQCILDSHDIDIKEHRFPSSADFLPPFQQHIIIPQRHEPTTSSSDSESTPEPPRIPTPPILDSIVVQPLSTKPIGLFTTSLDTIYEPKTFNDAVNCPDAPHWITAMQDEIQSMLDNDAFILCDLPPGCKC